MNKKPRLFDASFKLHVVKMIKDQGLSVSQVCQDMDILVMSRSARCFPNAAL